MKTSNRKPIQAILCLVFYLIVIDIAVNIIFQFPSDPEKISPSFLQGYFEYGRSVEGKLDRTMSQHIKSGGILGYGWIKNIKREGQPKRAGKNQTLVAIYGMSHAALLGEAIAKIDSRYLIRSVCAAGAPANWSFAAYDEDKDHHEAQVVILGIMTDSIPYMSATAGTTSFFEMGHPYTFPRYYVENNQLKQIYPPFFSAEGFREYFCDAKKWAEYRAWLTKNDKYYDTFLFKRSLIDRSAFLRVLRRAYANMVKQKIIDTIYTRDGFNPNCEEVIALRTMVREFGRSAKERHVLPIVYIVNNENRGDHLYKALKPTLDHYKIPYLSTHIICPPDNPLVFNGVNSHFTPAKDQELAREMIRIINMELERIEQEGNYTKVR